MRWIEEGSADLWCAMTGSDALSEEHCDAVYENND